MRAYELGESKAKIIDLLGGDAKLRSKRELILKFIEDNLQHITNTEAHNRKT
jgi:type I restriction enzyme R subunit